MPTFLESIFPRTTDLPEDAGMVRKLISPALDVASLPGRGVATAAGTLGELAGGGDIDMEAIARRLAETGMTEDQGLVEGIAEEITRDPANILMGAGLIPKVYKGLKYGSRLGRIVPPLAEGAASTVVHQVENVAEGKDVDPKEAGLEMATSLLPAGVDELKVMKIRKNPFKRHGLPESFDEAVSSVPGKVDDGLRYDPELKGYYDLEKAQEATSRAARQVPFTDDIKGDIKKIQEAKERALQELVMYPDYPPRLDPDMGNYAEDIQNIIKLSTPGARPELQPVRGGTSALYEAIQRRLEGE